ncbi:hypothetical protein [Nitrosospira sp. NpAV]|uniref:hypothetical protein n=1 Tax=Nitrosospira sp. NpAV TaxID=58133 RepID=UPI0005A213DC|nr:hypothetical protein [Nitrosospira sp. NpAV]KIO49067.1 hypothetical protein SQ11_08565 [Nitrosospira sp. NpAV]
MDLIDEKVAEKLVAFEIEQDPALVHESLDMIEAAERDVSIGDITARKQALAQRLRFFAVLDRNIDPMWNPEDKPVKGAAPPRSHGAVYGSGEVDPATIADPAMRAEYERALQASKDYGRRYDVQFQLRRIDERAMRFVERFLAERYSESPTDRQELEELLSAAPINDARKKQLRSFFPK